MTTKTGDGYTWDRASGVLPGLETEAVISPRRSLSSNTIYDVIVIGAGYAGLAAARDLANLEHKTLLIEARDRIGGRTYTAKQDGEFGSAAAARTTPGTVDADSRHFSQGFLYEMGGTWVTHHMGYLFREMMRYGMDRDLIETGSPGMHNGFYTINVPGATPRRTTHEEAGAMMAKAWDAFVNVDGQFGRTICPLPHAQLDNAIVSRTEVERWDQLSCQDRFEQIKHKLTAEEQGILVSLLLHISGGHMETSSLWDMIRSHALLMHNSDNFADVWLRYKLRDGQTALAKRLFDDAVDAGLQYAFSTPIKSIIQTSSRDGLTRITAVDGEEFVTRKVICTIPLNVLKDIHFDPPLSQRRQEAINIGHVNQMTKIHANISNTELERWNGMRFPGHLMYGYADGVLPSGEVHVVAFGADERDEFVPERQPEKAVAALNEIHPMDVNKLIFHNWASDQYSKGGPAWWRSQYMSKYQDELQSRHENTFFASGDWAHGWRASIDGALEQGILNAQIAHTELRKAKRLPIRGNL